MKEIKIVLKNNEISYKQLIEQLVDLDYYRVPMVLESGEFSVRGSIIDIYPVNHTHPIRIEYDENRIERLSSIDIHSQRSISTLKTTTVIHAKHQPTFKKLAQKHQNLNDDLVSSLFPGDYVIHEQFGIGIFKGLNHKSFSHLEGEYVEIHYKDNDKVFVPLNQTHIIHKYEAKDIPPQVNSLKEKTWKKTKEKAQKSIEDLAEDIFIIQKFRHSQKGFSFAEDTEKQLIFDSRFKFKLTPDQETAIKEIKSDMEKNTPMDRLLCGDVGFGKTEVLLRAAFKTTESYKQVAILVPTTILAEQHFQTALKRFENFNKNIGILSRFQNKKTTKETLKLLKSGQLDIIIGTHRLIQKDIEFFDLGLVIIDEEHRFGVKHKESLKKLKKNVDVLSISATPIPRTLYMSLTGTRNFSQLDTPPLFKRPIFTIVEPYEDKIVKKAIEAELRRKGQVYYIFNSVKEIEQKAFKIQKIIGNCKIGIAHGQMDEKKLQSTMSDFISKKIDILLCTTIVENGLDLKNVNTIIIEKAENMGLSQIHQLRGRVGRSKKQAYAYLLTHKTSTEGSKKRLQAIKEYVSLGSGYNLAIKDLEIRGAGNLLGKEQHGHMISIGFEYYCKLLDQAIKKVHGEKIESLPVLSLNSEQLTIPESYIPEARERLAVYKQFLSIKSLDDIKQIKDSLSDRYGRFPNKLNDIFDNLINEVKSKTIC